MDIERSIDNLSEISKNRKEKALHEEKIKKQYQWQVVKEKTPKIANFMILFAKHFGKPESVKVWNQDKLILDKE